MQIQVENIKCGGCAGNIRQKLGAIAGVTEVEVDIEQGLVSYQLTAGSENETVVAEVKAKLASMGYPEQGSIEGMAAVGAKAKSYVSCAIGKMNDKN